MQQVQEHRSRKTSSKMATNSRKRKHKSKLHEDRATFRRLSKRNTAEIHQTRVDSIYLRSDRSTTCKSGTDQSPQMIENKQLSRSIETLDFTWRKNPEESEIEIFLERERRWNVERAARGAVRERERNEAANTWRSEVMRGNWSFPVDSAFGNRL